jgi:hypothetical protein
VGWEGLHRLETLGVYWRGQVSGGWDGGVPKGVSESKDENRAAVVFNFCHQQILS